MKIKIKLAIASLIFFIAISPISFSALIDYSQASDYEEINEDQEWATDKIVDKDVFVGEDATLTIKKGVTVTFNSKNINVYGKIIIAGTLKDPVIFKKAENSQNYSILVWQGGELVMRNANVSGGGGFYFNVLQNNPILNSAYAYGSYFGAIHARGGTVNVQGTDFHDNDVATYVDSGSAGKVIINRSKFSNNSIADIAYAGYGQPNKVDARYNWWGNDEGPSKVCVDYSDPFGDCKIAGSVDVSSWLMNENFHDPIVIIPGIFGSQKEDDIWKIDPIFHTYDNLIDEFKDNRYVVGKDLFIFPYEWRDSNVINATKLKYKIAEIKTIAKWPKVDVVAHSMGGLLAREYIESTIYQGDIDQLITLGTPNNGSPEIYPFWEAGRPIGTIQSGMKKFLSQEVEEGDYADMFEYIRNRPVSSAQELLPNYEYLYDTDENEPLIYPEDYPANAFLDKLNNQANLKKLTNVEYTKIVGNVDGDASTIIGFDVVMVDMGKIWEHGYPISFEIPIIGDRGSIMGSGDRTVPFSSAKSVEIFAENYFELDSAHSDLPTKAQKDVLETLTNVRPTSEVTDSLIKNMLQILVHSPIDIQIISPTNKKYGKDFESNKNFKSIDGSFYTGFETKNEFITIPNPEDGEYEVLTQGTDGGGEYRIEIVNLSQGESDESIESTIEINGLSISDKIEELKVQVDGGQITEKNQDEIPPVTEISITGTQGDNNWYTSDTELILSATDNENGSGIQKTEYSLDDGKTWKVYTDFITLTAEGISEIQYLSTDKQGNAEGVQKVMVKIDKTAPEAKMIFHSTTQKLDVLGTDNLSQSVSVETKKQTVFTGNHQYKGMDKSWAWGWFQKPKEKKIIATATLKDEAGHRTEIVWEKKNDKSKRIDLSLSSISYDGQKTNINRGILQYKWAQNWRKNMYVLFASHLSTELMSLESHYFPNKNQTWLMEKPKEIADDDKDDNAERRPVWKRMMGMIIPSMLTEKGAIKISY